MARETRKESRQASIKILRRYNENAVCIEMMEQDLEALANIQVGIDNMGVSYDQPVVGPTYKITSMVENEVIRIDEKRGKLTHAINWRKRERDNVDLALRSMKHDLRRLLVLRYIEGGTWWSVAQQLGYSEEYTRKELNSDALNQFTVLMFPTTAYPTE